MSKSYVLKIVSIFLLAFNLSSLHAVVFIMYHRVGDSAYPSTNVTTHQFKQEMAYLATEHYHVWPASKIISHLRSGAQLPPKTVGIMFDDAYDTVYYTAWPILKKYHFPFTLFVATGPVDQKFKGMLTWQQIKEMADAGVEIGNHSVNHPYLPRLSLAQMNKEIAQAQQRLRQELDMVPQLFAYPYGEYSTELVNLIKNFHFIAAFTQTSGAVDSFSDFYRLPRFPLNEDYADFDRFKMILTMRPLHIQDLRPSEIILKHTPRWIQFHLLHEPEQFKQFNCFYGGKALPVDKCHLPVVQIRMEHTFTERRNKINCTAQDQHGDWYWLGLLYLQY